ncbi:hypothetical protein [Streptomyces aureoversilis]|uniref:Lipoprotein n=1 Tax=Streptomyces aureoversilis TaxID=67277 RepID=A0ABW0A5J5_9ACTN
MRRSTVRRTALAASAMSLALLVSACGSEKSEGKKDEPKGKASASAPAAGKAASAEELGKLILAEGDVPGHKVTEATAADLATAKGVTSDKAECKPLVDAMSLRSGGAPAALVIRKVIAMPKSPAPDAAPEDKMKAGLSALGGTITSDTLGSYGDAKAAGDVIAALKKSGADCAGGFNLVAGSDKTKFTKVAPADFAAGGDEAVSFTLNLDAEGTTGTTHLIAVRKGSTVATFYALSLAGQAEQPKAVVEGQVKKLG